MVKFKTRKRKKGRKKMNNFRENKQKKKTAKYKI